jgi:hypothetical protein
LRKLSDANFGALQVRHDGHFTPGPLGCVAHALGAVDVVLRAAVAEVQPHDIHPSANHFFEQGRVAGRRAKGCNNFGGAAGGTKSAFHDEHSHMKA